MLDGIPLSVRMCNILVTRVSAPFGQLSTRSKSSGESIPIPLTCKKEQSIITNWMRQKIICYHLIIYYNTRIKLPTVLLLYK